MENPFLNILLLQALTSYAQKAPCYCPRPSDGKFENIFTLVGNQDLAYRKQFREMACVDLN